MAQAEIKLLKSNFQKVEDKFISFFKEGSPRWPGEEHDLLRNHHKNVDDLSMKMITFEKLGLIDLPDDIVKEMALAFEAFQKMQEYK